MYQAELQKCQDIITHLKTRYVPYAKDPGKDNIVMIIEKNTTLKKVSFMSITTILREYKDGSLTQKDDGLKHNTPIIGL